MYHIITIERRYASGGHEIGKSWRRRLRKAAKNIIEKAAEEGNCVIVGRASGYILRDKESCLRVFIYANHEKRIQRAIRKTMTCT